VEIGTYRQVRRSLWDREGHVPPIFMKGASMVMSPNILEVKSFRMSTRVTATLICCILTQILCVVSQKKLQLLGDFVLQAPYRGFTPGPRWGPQTPSVLLCPPNNPVRSTPLHIGCLGYLHTKPTWIVASCDPEFYRGKPVQYRKLCGVLHFGGIQRLV